MSATTSCAAAACRCESDPTLLSPSDTFLPRHIGPGSCDQSEMLAHVGATSLDDLTERAIPVTIRTQRPLAIPDGRSEFEAIQELHAIAQRNRVLRSCIGMGYHDTITPPVILRNVLENPGWYTQYTPYQAEIAQGRLEALLNFQTMIADLTGLPLANASLLDEATAAAEAMVMCRAIAGEERASFIVAPGCHPQTIAVVQARASALGLKVRVEDPSRLDLSAVKACGVLLQYPDTHGIITDWSAVISAAHAAGSAVVMSADPLALTLLRSPGEFGADIAIGSTQRFGVPMGFGGPHAAYLATKEEHARKMPGRIVGVSRDATGRPALRLAIQTREQHIKRDRATSNICTAQVLLAIVAGLYAAYHGPDGLKRIAGRVHALTVIFGAGLSRMGFKAGSCPCFDTLRINVESAAAAEKIHDRAVIAGYNLRRYAGEAAVGVSFDETTTREDVSRLWKVFGGDEKGAKLDIDAIHREVDLSLGQALTRRTPFLTHEVFSAHHSETQMLRYITWLQGRDLSLAQSMISLGSCTMKLNATSEMIPVTWPNFARIHPFAPRDQVEGYHLMFRDLEGWLADITGFSAVSLQPNAGSQGEYAGLLVIRAYHESRGEGRRHVCLIPNSAHGTNPASAVAAGFSVVPVECDEKGNVDLADLRARAEEHAADLAALMITYPSTHGVYEESVREICRVVHAHGGQVYLDGANMNAMVGLCRPGEIGADVCHLNLHKTFCIPHGGGGPGMGPIGVAAHLAPFLPTHPVAAPSSAGAHAIGPISAAPYGSPMILVIPWMYIRMMGGKGLRRATQVAILNANYMAARLREHYDVLFTGPGGFNAHEFILDFRAFDRSAGIKMDDIAKRLMDYGFHAPTMSFPVPGTLMIEPTESEPRSELDRFCDTLIAIRQEIRAIEKGEADRTDNPLKNAPHTIEMLVASEWKHAYPRDAAAYPAPWLRANKFWPPVARIDNPFGDRHLVCTCEPMSSYTS